MILPSDEDPRKDDDARSKGEGDDDKLPWENDPDPPGFFGADEPEEPAGASVHNPAPPGWREDLQEDLEDALAELKEIEDPAEDFDPPEPPDLFTFYGELVAMRNEMRAIGGAVAQLIPGAPTGLPGGIQEILASIIDVSDGLEERGKEHLPLLTPLLKAAGLTRIKVKAGAAFDAASMSTDDKVRTGSKVAREIFSGWIWNNVVIRPAVVKLK